MATRIRYKKAYDQNNHVMFVTQEFQVLDKVYKGRYITNNNFVEIIDMDVDAPVQYTIFETTKQAKLWIKSRLKRLGVKFDPEVRRKKEHKQELQKAIEEKNND
jgi:hypothetical protein